MAESHDHPPSKTTAEPEPASREREGFGSVLAIVGFLFALAGGYWIGQLIKGGNEIDWQGYDDSQRYEVKLRGDEPQLGPDDALVTIIEFSDYQCPYCRSANGPLMDVVEDHDDVRLIFKHHPLPLHQGAIPAARAAWAAHQQGKFWEMHEHLFDVSGKLDDIDEVAERMGLDVDRFRRDMLSQEAIDAVENDRYAASVLGIGSTPHFVVNGRHLRGSMTESHWERVVELERSEAEALVDQGVAPARLYAHLMSSAKKSRAREADGGPDRNKRHVVPAGEGRPSLGPDDALVTLVVFSDFQCPFCARVAPTIHGLPVSQPELRVVFRQSPMPSHRMARPAAAAALAAHRQGKFWEMHDALFAVTGELDESTIVEAARAIGLDMQRFAADRSDPAIEAMIDEDIALAKSLRVMGTPASFVNGIFINGAQAPETFAAIVERERNEAQRLVDQGTPRAKVVDALLATPGGV